MNGQPEIVSPPKSRGLTLRFCRIVLYGSLGIFGAWCLLDFALLRLAPSRIIEFDWVLLPMPIVVCFGNAALLRDVSIGLRVVLSVLASILATVFGFVLILVFGLGFHFLFGGQL